MGRSFEFNPLKDLDPFGLDRLRFHHDEPGGDNGLESGGSAEGLVRGVGGIASHSTVEVDPLDEKLKADFNNEGGLGEE